MRKSFDLRVMIDSGAHTFFNKYHKNKSDSLRFKYYRLKSFKKYLEDYIKFLHEHAGEMACYVGLDVIGYAKETYDINMYMRSCGLDPIPVIHYGTGKEWVKKYLDVTDYIGISGLGQDANKSNYVRYGDEMFKYVCGDGKKKILCAPSVKVHGFAMSTAEMMVKYPYYSMDSSTWVKQAGYGSVLLPEVTGGNGKDRRFNYLKGRSYKATERHFKSGAINVLKLPPAVREVISDYVIEHCKVASLEDACDNYYGRRMCNVHYMLSMQRDIKKVYAEKFNYAEGGNLFLASMADLPRKDFDDLTDTLDVVEGSMNILASYFKRSRAEFSLRLKRELKRPKLNTRRRLNDAV